MNRARTAIVTGAARGIGRATAARLIRDGFRVVIADIDEAKAHVTATELAAGDSNRTFVAPVDVSEPSSVQGLVSAVLQWTGQIDVLVNNAGIAGLTQSVSAYPIQEWRRIMAINLDGVFYC